MPAALESMIRELPEAERPRERLLDQGGHVLSDIELLAVLLRTGLPGRSALQMAVDLLTECGGLSGLPALGAPALKQHGL
ncbi:MAG: UPF0758 domain-containing protein, partial [Thermoanaerobaculia bacterium]